MADNVIRVNVTTVAPKSVTIQGSKEQNYINATGDTSGYNAQLSKNWATGEGKIQGIDYSSKHYAGVAREQAGVAREQAELASENLNNVQEIVTGFGETAGNATSELAQVKNDALIDISNLNSSVIEGIETASGEAIEEIELTKTSAVAEVITNKGTAINAIAALSSESIANIEAKGQEQISNIQSTGFYMRDDKLYFINSKGEEEEFKSGGAGYVMFDTVLKDHVLTYEESKGLALQGTYVYKEAVAGSRYGYPDFYAKCLEEYNEAEGLPWEQPKITSKGVMGGDSFAVEATDAHSSYPVYNAFNGDISTHWLTNSEASSQFPVSLVFYNPISLNVTNLKITNRGGGNTYPTNGAIYGSNTNSNYELISTFTNSVGGVNSSWDIHLSSNSKYYKYYKIEFTGGSFTSTYNFGVANIEITATQSIRKNPNGHLFYDISAKDQIDEIFESTGMAWMYGIDTENERVFLPRNNWFIQPTGETTKVNSVNEAGLPNITGYIQDVNQFANATSADGVFERIAISNSNYIGTNAQTGAYTKYTFDASRSSSIYGNSDTVQPPSINQLLYICVGNTNVESAVTDVVDVTTTENDTIPLGYSTYQNGTQPSVSWLKSEGQWNDGNLYSTFYNVYAQQIGQNFASGKVVESTDEYTDYDLVINQTDMTFRLPLLDGSEDLAGDERVVLLSTAALNGQYVAPKNGIYHLAYTTNKIGAYAALRNITTQMSGDIVQHQNSSYTTTYSNILEVKKGDTVTIVGGDITFTRFDFVPAIGNGSLYFKVANAVQNLELLDAGEVLEAVSTKTSRAEAAAASMPSDKYIDLTLGASGTKYTAPANGYFVLRKATNAVNQYVHLHTFIKGTTTGEQNIGYGVSMREPLTNGFAGGVMLPVKKGDSVVASYSAGGTLSYFRFIYAEGEEV